MKQYTVKQYMNAIERALRVDWKTRVRIMNDLGSDFQSRRDAGQTDEQIMAELGSPKAVAAEFNAAFAEEHGPYQSPLRWVWLALAVLLPLAANWTGLQPAEASSIGIIGGADGPTAIFVTARFGWSDVLPWAVGFLALFLLAGWCRKSRGRLWLPLLLCAVVSVWSAVSQLNAAYAMATFGTLPAWMYFIANVLSNGTVFCLGVLGYTLWQWKTR